MSLTLVIVITVCCLFGSAFCSGTETGLMSVSRIRIYLREKQSSSSKLIKLKKYIEKIEAPILACLIGTNLFNVIATSVVTAYLISVYKEKGELYATIIMAVVIIVFGEIIPKVLYREYPESMTLNSVVPLRLFMWIVLPVSFILRLYSKLLTLILPGSSDEIEEEMSRESVGHVVASYNPGLLDKQFKLLADRCLDLNEIEIISLIQKIDSVVLLNKNMTIAQCKAIAADSGFSRLPLTDSGGHISGWVLARDLLFLTEDYDSKVPEKIIRKVVIVDGMMSPWELFEELRWHQQQIAFVVDGNRELKGVVTLEDLLEVVVGKIDDEFDY